MADEQVGNSSYLTMTPGSAVAGQLQQILTSKRLEARQALLDSLNQKNVESQIADRDENTKTNQAYRESLAENHKVQEELRKAEADKIRLGNFGETPGPVGPEDAAFLQRVAPTRIQSAPGANTLPSTQAPMAAPIMAGQPSQTRPIGSAQAQQPDTSLPTGMTPSPSVPDKSVPATNMYMGSPSYQKQHEAQQKLEALADPKSGFSSLSPEQQLLKIATIFPNADPNAVLERLMTSKSQAAPGRLILVDGDTRQATDTSTGKPFKGTIGPNDHVQTIAHSPRVPPEHDKVIWDRPVLNPDGTPNPGKLYVERPNGSINIIDAPGGTHPGDKNTKPAKPLVIPPTQATNLGKLKAMAMPKTGMLWDSPPDPQALSAYHTAMNTTVYNAVKDQSPAFQALAQHIVKELQDPNTDPKLTVEEIINEQGEGLTPVEKNNLRTILEVIK